MHILKFFINKKTITIESKRKELIWKYKKLNKIKIINQCKSLEEND